MAPPPLTDEQFDYVVGGMLAGDFVYMSMPKGMSNHAECYGLMPKKTADGSRVIRYSEDPHSLTTEARNRPIIEGASIQISHALGTFSDIFCEFNHGVQDVRAESELDASGRQRSRRSDAFHARLNLAQLRLNSEVCALCSVLTQGIDRWRWVWQPRLNKLRYCDEVYRKRHLLPAGNYMELFAGADDNRYDQRFLPGPLRDDEVALYIDFTRDERTLRVNVQKPPTAEMSTRRMTSLMDLEVFIEVGGHSPWAAIQPLPTISRNVLSERSLDKLHGWINDCIMNHEQCIRSSTEGIQQPTRLMEIKSTITGEISIHLVETDPDDSYKYIALSHSWAASRPLKTDRYNYAEYKDDIPWEKLSTVYQDTITLAKALHVSYVWIDSLCIIQQDAEEWGREAHRMGSVYSNAFLVFVALGDELALEKDPIETFTIQGVEKESGQEVYMSTNINIRRKIEHDNLVNSANDSTASQSWFSRGWCFQERLFATRLLHFGGGLEDITFECNTHLKCECGGVDHLLKSQRGQLTSLWCHTKAQFTHDFDAVAKVPANDMDDDELLKARDDLLAMYIGLCEDFSSKKFSFTDDSLPAMDSLTSKLGPYLGTYHAGLWEHNILIGMQWESFDATDSHRYTPCCAPSFSWASCTGGAIWYFDPKSLLADLDNREFAEVVEVLTIPADPNIPYGKVIFSGITIRGYAKPAIIEPQEPDRVGRMYLNEEEDGQWVQMDTQDDIDDVFFAERLPGSGTAWPVLCVELMRSWATSGRGTRCFVSAIVLTPHDEEEGTLRRVGFAILDREFFDDGAMFATFSIR